MRIFNPTGDDRLENRQMWGGNPTGLINLNSVRYPWAVKLYAQMREQFWIPQKYDLTTDVTDYGNLTEDERRGFDGILSYLTFLDSIQTANLPYLRAEITAPEVALCLSEQASQEAMHNQSYQYIIETLIPSDRRNGIYEYWREDPVLLERCETIAQYYQKFQDSHDPGDYFYALVANYLLEGLYFYNGFTFFYSLASRQLMPGTADVVKVINRDELSHVRLFQTLVKEAMTSSAFHFSVDRILEMVDSAVTQEVEWSSHILQDRVLGITTASTEQYTKWLANQRLKAIGLNPLYSDTKNPYPHLEKIADTSKDASVKANFFEAGVTAYSMSEAVDGWDEF